MRKQVIDQELAQLDKIVALEYGIGADIQGEDETKQDAPEITLIIVNKRVR